MFAKPSWFATKTRPVTRPATWQGRVYMAIWMAACAVPTCYFLTQRLLPEALIWSTASLGAFAWDWRSIRRASPVTATPTAPPSPSSPANDGIEFVDGVRIAKSPLRRAYSYFVH